MSKATAQLYENSRASRSNACATMCRITSKVRIRKIGTKRWKFSVHGWTVFDEVDPDLLKGERQMLEAWPHDARKIGTLTEVRVEVR